MGNEAHGVAMYIYHQLPKWTFLWRQPLRLNRCHRAAPQRHAAGHTVRLNLSVLQQQYPHLFEVPQCASLFNSLGYCPTRSPCSMTLHVRGTVEGGD